MRRLAIILAPLVLIGGLLIAGATPAQANANITATSVGKAISGRDTNCADASLAIGMNSVSVTTESGTVTNLGGQLSTFQQSSSFSGFSGVFPDYGQSTGSPQPDGTVIGSYATIGSSTPTASDTAEWFLLYRCGPTTADSVVLSSCFGDYGTCPKTAAEGVATLFGGSVDDTTPAPGQVITVSGEGCFYPLGGALLLDGGTGLDGGSVAPNPDGTFQVDLTVPADRASGTALQVRVDCGNDGQTILSTSIALTVAAPATTEAPTTTSSRPPGATTQPRFTG
jgi:hypothetical protein